MVLALLDEQLESKRLSEPMPYVSQAIDTSETTDQALFQLWQNHPEKRLVLLRCVNRVGRLILGGIKRQYPDADDFAIAYHYRVRRLGLKWANLAGNLPLTMKDHLELASEIGQILKQLQIDYYIGGSVASIIHGEPRLTQDIDLVLNLTSDQVELLLQAFSNTFYISEIAVREAVNHKTDSFNIIDLESALKVDCFILKNNDFALSQMQRKCLFTDQNEQFYIASAEDIILQKLLWHKKANYSQQQWRDILGVLKQQKDDLDFRYLRQWSNQLNLICELDLALEQAGIF